MNPTSSILKVVLTAVAICVLVVILVTLPHNKNKNSQQELPNVVQNEQTTEDTEQPQNPVPTKPQANILGSYYLASFDGMPVPTSLYTLTIEQDRLGAKFCNGMGGDYASKNGVLTAQLVSTMMYCESPAGLMDMETAFSTMMDKGAIIIKTPDTLTLSGSGHTFIYR